MTRIEAIFTRNDLAVVQGNCPQGKYLNEGEEEDNSIQMDERAHDWIIAGTKERPAFLIVKSG